MPTITGKFQLSDYDRALVVRGFDQFEQIDRYQMINLGYREVARQFPWLWAETSATFTVNPGEFSIPMGNGGDPGDMDSIEGIDLATDPYRRKLEPEEEHRFKEKWLYLDLTLQQNQGQPAKFFLYQGLIYILPPPQLALDFKVYFKQFLPDMVDPTDTSAIPQVFDEIILDAGLVRCHRRAHELTLAADAQQRVDMAIAEMLRDEAWQNEELQERTIPDNQWW